MPTVLFFTANRAIYRPPSDQIVIAKPQNLNYQPCHIFSREEGDWRNSIDNLLCWLTWLSEGNTSSEKSHFDRACNTVNELVIDDSDKRLKLLKRDPPEPYIEASGKYHRLDRLSSGELSRLQIVLRTASLMTSNTILIIDELELHLHPITVLLALFFWGLLWGFAGMFLAAPLTAIIRIIFMQFDTLRPIGKLLAGEFSSQETISK